MDRNREARRGGSVGGPLAPRRPRTTGLKDSLAADDDDIADEACDFRLREAAKKEGCSVTSLMYAGGVMSVSRNKRKRHIVVQEVQVRSTEDIDETTEETEMGVSVSEDDDDLPPPPVSRRSGKLRFEAKSRDDGSAVDLSTVPRKARTVIMKRPHESPALPVGDFAKQQMASSLSLANTATAASSAAASKLARRMKPSSSKSRVSKPPKVSVSTSSISEQEVEVAEALFDLARMLPIHASPSISESNVDLKPEPKFEPVLSVPASVLSHPVATSSPVLTSEPEHVCPTTSPMVCPSVSPAMSSVPAVSQSLVLSPAPLPAEAPKRKRPRVRPKREDTGSIQVCQGLSSSRPVGAAPDSKGELEQMAQSTVERVQVKLETNATGSGSSMPSTTGSHTFTSTAIPTPSASVQRECIVEKKPPLVGELNPTVSVQNNSMIVDELQSSAPVPEKKNAFASSAISTLCEKEHEVSSQLATAGDSLTKLEHGKRLLQSPSSDAACPEKFEIDLMAPPNAPPNAMGIVANEKIEGLDGSGLVGDAKEQKDLVKPTESIWIYNEKAKKGNDGNNYRDGEDKGTGIEMDQDRDLGHAQVQVAAVDYGKESQNEAEKEGERDKGKVDFTNQTSQITFRNNDAGSRLQGTEKYGTPSFLGSSPLTSSNMSISVTNTSLPVSFCMAGWPGNLPPLGYYSPATVAAARPSGASIGGASSVNMHSMPILQAPPFNSSGLQRLWKHCSRHVYIAHFIDWQEQMQRHPFWATTYANNIAGIYGAKSYNLNIPLPPADTKFGSGAGNVARPAGASDIEPGGNNGSGLCTGPLKDSVHVAAVNFDGSNDRVPLPYFDALATKLPLQQSAQLGRQLPLSTQIGTTIGFPVTQVSSSAVGNGVPTAMTESGATTGGAASLIGSSSGSCASHLFSAGSGAVVGAGVDSTKGSVVNAAAAQAQFLQAMIQHTGFPFSFPTAHFGPTFNGPLGHITQQQASQVFGNPFYNTNLAHSALQSQQGQGVTVSTSSDLNLSQKHHHDHDHHHHQHLQQAVFNLQPSGSPQQQPPPASPSQSQQQPSLGAGSQQLQHPLDMESNMMGGESGSAQTQVSSLQRNMYTHVSPHIQVSSLNPSSLLTSSMPALPGHHHDFSFMASLGGKQTDKKLQHHHHQVSVQLEPHQQSNSSSQAQPPLSFGHHMVSLALPMGLKSMEQVSQAFSPMSAGNMARSSVDPGPLGLPSSATVMSPEGHAVLQSMADSTRGNSQSLPGQIHQHVILQGHQQHSVLMQKERSNGVEGNHTSTCESIYSNIGCRDHDPTEDRKIPVKRTTVLTGIQRDDLEVSSNGQGSPNTGSGSGLSVPQMESSTSATPNLMPSVIGKLTSWSSGQLAGNLPATTSSVSQNIKTGMGQSQITPNTVISTSSAMAEPSPLPFSDQMLGSTLSKVFSLGLPFSGSSVKSSRQTNRFGHSSPNVSQIKLAQKPSLGSVLPAPISPPATFAGMVKNQEQSHPRVQQLASSISPGSRASLAPSSGSPSLTSLPSVSKSCGVAAGVAKSTSVLKSSFPVSQKRTGTSPGKRPGSSVAPGATTQGSSSMAQSTPAKMVQRQLQSENSIPQQHNLSQPLQHNQTPLIAVQQSLSRQCHQQQNHPMHKQSLQQQQFQFRPQFLFHQQPYFFQQQPQEQQPSQSCTPAVQPQAMMFSSQHRSGQPVQQLPMPTGSLGQQQQVRKHVQPQQTLHSSQQSQALMPLETAANGELSLATPNLTLGNGSAGKVSPDGRSGILNQAALSRPATPVKSMGNSVTHLGTGLQRHNSSGPAFLYSQSPPSCSTSGKQQSSSNCLQSGPGFDPVEKLMEDKLVTGTSSARASQPALGMSPSPLLPSFHPQVGGSVMKYPGHQIVPGNIGEMHSSWSEKNISSSSSSSSSSSCHSGMFSGCSSLNAASSIVNGTRAIGCHLNSDGKGMLGTSSINQAMLSQHQPLSSPGQPEIAIATDVTSNVVSSTTVMLGQASAGLVQL